MRLLVVEDEPGVAEGLHRALTGEGFQVDTAADGRTGLTMALSRTYDAILLDVLLPEMNGFKVCAALRERGEWTPILMITAKTGEYDEAEALDLGADDYIRKPFAMVVVAARVKAVLRRPRIRGTVPFSAGDLKVDPVRHRCWRGDVEIQLSAREMDVLAHLMSHHGDVVAKEGLLEKVWGDGFRGDPNIVEVYVRRLRRKIDEPFGQSTIDTVRGVGYRIPDSGA